MNNKTFLLDQKEYLTILGLPFVVYLQYNIPMNQQIEIKEYLDSYCIPDFRTFIENLVHNMELYVWESFNDKVGSKIFNFIVGDYYLVIDLKREKNE